MLVHDRVNIEFDLFPGFDHGSGQPFGFFLGHVLDIGSCEKSSDLYITESLFRDVFYKLFDLFLG